MAACVMYCGIVVYRSIDSACSQTIGNRYYAEHYERIACRKTKKRRRGKRNAHCGNFSGSEALCHSFAHKARCNRSETNYHGNYSRIGNRNAEFVMHGGPGSAKQSIRQTEAYKRYINYCKKKTCQKITPFKGILPYRTILARLSTAVILL